MALDSSKENQVKTFNPIQYLVHRLLYTPIFGYFIYLIGVQFREGQYIFFGPYSPYFPYTTQDVFISAFWFLRDIFETVFTSAFGVFMSALFGSLGLAFAVRIFGLVYQREVVQKGKWRFEAKRRFIRIRYASSYYFKGILETAYLVVIIPSVFIVALSALIIVLLFPTLAQEQGFKASQKKVTSYNLCYQVRTDGILDKDKGRCTCVYMDGKLESFGWTVDASKEYILLYRLDKPTKLQPMKDRTVTTSLGKMCSEKLE
ncbi:hypothetical protein [Teredinibacter turnerae]|uniref:hypothetical protein n=1 Tax=Teredinibacter turnerae TaxID=2426 RepID=UPI00036BF9AC|nr:hypothetical protein [Teredinibacter turnerae]